LSGVRSIAFALSAIALVNIKKVFFNSSE